MMPTPPAVPTQAALPFLDLLAMLCGALRRAWRARGALEI
jgi:hypothetical protein